MGKKDVENRSWSTNHRGPLLIHASKTLDDLESGEAEEHLPADHVFHCGGIVGMVELVDVVEDSDSEWAYPGENHWVLKKAKRLPFRPMKGRVGFLDVPWPLPAGGEGASLDGTVGLVGTAAELTRGVADDSEEDVQEEEGDAGEAPELAEGPQPGRRKGGSKGRVQSTMTRQDGLEKLTGFAERMGIAPSDIKVRAAGGGAMRLAFAVNGVEISRTSSNQDSIDLNFLALVLWLGDLLRNVERGVETFRDAFYADGASKLVKGPDVKAESLRQYTGKKTIGDSLRAIERSLERLDISRDRVKVIWENDPPMARIRIALPGGGRLVEKVSAGQEDDRTNLASLALWLQSRAKNLERGIEHDLNTLFAANLLPERAGS